MATGIHRADVVAQKPENFKLTFQRGRTFEIGRPHLGASSSIKGMIKKKKAQGQVCVRSVRNKTRGGGLENIRSKRAVTWSYRRNTRRTPFLALFSPHAAHTTKERIWRSCVHSRVDLCCIDPGWACTRTCWLRYWPIVCLASPPRRTGGEMRLGLFSKPARIKKK